MTEAFEYPYNCGKRQPQKQYFDCTKTALLCVMLQSVRAVGDFRVYVMDSELLL